LVDLQKQISWIAGLPKQKKFCRPVVYADTGLFYGVQFNGQMEQKVKEKGGLE
jgi:hypothetical protein